jgi:hypothetical protein
MTDASNQNRNIPEGIEPLFLTGPTCEIFKIKPLTEEETLTKPYKLLLKSEIVSDMQTRLAISDFTPFKTKVLVNNIISLT